MKRHLILALFLTFLTKNIQSGRSLPTSSPSNYYQIPPPSYQEAMSTNHTQQATKTPLACSSAKNRVISSQPSQNDSYPKPGYFLNERACCVPSSCYDPKSFTSRYCPFSTHTSSAFCEITSCCCCCQSGQEWSYNEEATKNAVFLPFL